jgi:hypothetical protein
MCQCGISYVYNYVCNTCIASRTVLYFNVLPRHSITPILSHALAALCNRLIKSVIVLRLVFIISTAPVMSLLTLLLCQNSAFSCLCCV